MTLVERFIEFNGWPTSRKTALLTGLTLPGYLLSWAACAALAPTGIVNTVLLNEAYAAGVGGTALCFVISLAALWAGKDARWTAYTFVVLYSVPVFATIYGLGIWSTPFFAIMPSGVLLAALYYDKQIAWFSCLFSLFLIAGIGALQLAGTLPYAPALLNRNLDSQQGAGWIAAVMVPVVITYLVCFALCLLIVAARNLQDVRLQKAQKLIRRYVPAQVADVILTGHSETVDTHARRKLTFFFSDLVNFTDIAEQLEPEDLSKVLNEYFTEMTAIAQRYDGTVDELSGDAILIFFGAPQVTNDKDHALRAVRMAVDMQAAVQSLNVKWQAAGLDVVFSVRMGINTGVATIGNFGSEGRTKYAALGRNVNLAARLQSHCEPGRVLLSHATWLLVHDEIPCAEKGEMQFKGIHKPVAVYELASDRGTHP